MVYKRVPGLQRENQGKKIIGCSHSDPSNFAEIL